MRGLREQVENIADASVLWIGEVKAPLVEPRQAHQVVERRGNEVDGDEIDVPTLEPDHRAPGGQPVAHPLDQLEEVVGPVDLVHRAVGRVAHHHARPVDAPADARRSAHQRFGRMLGAKIGMGESLALIEHSFVNTPR